LPCFQDLSNALIEAHVPWAEADTVVVAIVAVVAEPLEPQQVVVQDDLDQLLDMLPADLGSMLITHPNRPQLVEVSKLRFVGQQTFLERISGTVVSADAQRSAGKQQDSWHLHAPPAPTSHPTSISNWLS
jgi:hypothetical protein